MEIPSRLLQEAVDQFASLPGIGRKTALRLALHLLRREKEEVNAFSNSFSRLRNEIQYCQKCNNISDHQICHICANTKRNPALICVVEDIRDIMAIENTGQYNGLYHVLGGIISPMDGIGPNELHIDSLINRIPEDDVKEVILALSATMEGDTTNFYLYRKLAQFNVDVTTIAKGVSIGNELEYTDEITLGRSIVNRTLFKNTLNQ